MEERFEKVERFVKEGKEKEEGNLLIAVIVGILLVVIAVIFITAFGLNTNQIIIFILLVIAFYIITLSFLFEHRLIREIMSTVTKTVEKPSEKSIQKEVIKNIDRPVFYEIEKPIIRDVIKPVDRMVFIKREKLDIPKYKYIGSSETKNYHLKTCRFGKLIKNKYKILNNDPRYFIKNGFSPCKVCILKTKKV